LNEGFSIIMNMLWTWSKFLKIHKLEKMFENLHNFLLACFFGRGEVPNQLGLEFLSHLKPTPF